MRKMTMMLTSPKKATRIGAPARVVAACEAGGLSIAGPCFFFSPTRPRRTKGTRAKILRITGTMPSWKLVSSLGPGTLAPNPHLGEKSWKNSTKSPPQA